MPYEPPPPQKKKAKKKSKLKKLEKNTKIIVRYFSLFLSIQPKV